MELNIPAIEGIGGLQIYLVDRYGAKGSIYDVDFEWLGERDPHPRGSACTTSTTSRTTCIAAA
jgi:4-hydroxyphenylpyruvate dioxygenase